MTQRVNRLLNHTHRDEVPFPVADLLHWDFQMFLGGCFENTAWHCGSLTLLKGWVYCPGKCLLEEWCFTEGNEWNSSVVESWWLRIHTFFRKFEKPLNLKPFNSQHLGKWTTPQWWVSPLSERSQRFGRMKMRKWMEASAAAEVLLRPMLYKY